MKNKVFWIPLIVSIGTMSVLYLCGYLFNVEFLQWFYYKETSTGFTSGASINPIIIGFIVGFLTERIYRKREKKRTDLV